jgi:hypothetical protein
VKNLLAGIGQAHLSAALILGIPAPAYQTPLFQSIHQSHDTVVAQLELFRQERDGRRGVRRRALDGQQQLMVLRLDARAPRGLLADPKEPPDFMAELG